MVLHTKVISFLQEAFDMARFSVGYSYPNPSVGAVIINQDHKVIGRGFTNKAGSHHAEIMAIQEAIQNYGKNSLYGAILFVTLEPCVHYGRTPPCVESIVSCGIKKVYIASLDASSKVNGKGVQYLKEHEVEVEVLPASLFYEEKYFTLDSFFYKEKYGIPKFFLKWAQTKEGYLSPLYGPSGPISSPLSTEVYHRLRVLIGAVVVTPATIINDMPRLNARITKQTLFSHLPSISYFKKLLGRFEESIEDHNKNIYNEIQSLQNKRYFIMPRIQDGSWSIENLYLFIQKQQDIGGSYFFFVCCKQTSIILQKANVPFDILDSIYDFNFILKRIGLDGYNQCIIEAGPKYLEYLYQNTTPNGLIWFQSQNNLNWEGGRSFTLSKAIAVSTQNTLLEHYRFIESVCLDTDELYFYTKE